MGVLFSHQALGDLEKVSPAFRNIVLSNTNLKIVMRNNDPDTTDYFARSFGTRTEEKITKQKTFGPFGSQPTGAGSAREVESFICHPNNIRTLNVGEGFVSIPHHKGAKS